MKLITFGFFMIWVGNSDLRFALYITENNTSKPDKRENNERHIEKILRSSKQKTYKTRGIRNTKIK